ncbi:MAG: bifunctional UDP-N-acetylmuramoyl-tripeptide:D-alanyl-D-alanine ligase/alanine racemase [Muribaculaceae bacterium]|nr:bifunctional UDP-N-acetylmuramoyl-tripeptide:D-alanyl-D-alanine ligase/alanine racemase [Muribaculaceae bacterium]
MKLQADKIGELMNITTLSTTEIDTLLTDSRNLTVAESSMFFAIPTPNGNDGHKYMRPLYDKGVRHFVANYIPEDMEGLEDAIIMLTEDTVGALQRLAGSLPRPENMEMVAITGSRGKTTLKEWIYQLTEPLCEISRSPRSYNSQIGVPLSLWEITEGSEVALIEAGVSEKGEMERLERCIKPHTVIFTNIGEAHAEGFGSAEEKAEEKGRMAMNAETIIFPGDDAMLREALLPYSGDKKFIVWSRNEKCEGVEEFLRDVASQHFIMKEKDREAHLWEVIKGDESFVIPMALTTDAEVENAGNATAFMIHRGYPLPLIKERFSNLYKIGTRLNVTEGVNGCSLVLDSYTSDVTSLLPAIQFMMRRGIAGQRSVVVMSDVQHETGDSRDAYGKIAQVIKDTGADRFIGVGKEMKRNADLFKEDSLFFDSTEELLESLHPSDFVNEAILIKGAPSFGFGRIIELLEARKHETVLEVNLDAMIRNYNYFRSHLPAGTGIVAMVKASGYGAGSYEIAKTLQDCGAAYLAVAVLDEGIELRKKGIRMPIMVMNPKVVNYRSMFSNRLEPEIYSFEMLLDVVREAEKNSLKDYPIHIKLDTGMHRMGFIGDELDEVIRIVNSQKGVRVASVFSHLATADCVEMDDYTELQLSRFQEMTETLMRGIPYPFKRHILNSAGILRYGDRHHYDMARLGIGLYGANTLPESIEKPLSVVSTLRTVIIAIREWEADETIGYGRWGKLTRRSKIATIPIGYADGMNRHFGRGNISVRVNGKDAPTVGNICMDACMIDVTGIDCKVGDAVEIFGNEAPLQRLADALDTIPYEVLTSVSPRVKRIYYRE